MAVTRRHLVRLLSTGGIAAGTFSLTLPVTGAAAQPARLPGDAVSLDFPQGVASADPRQDAVMLWTRAVPAGGRERAPLLLQLSDSESFEQPLLEELLQAEAEHDYTVRAWVEGLREDRHYYYRFLGARDSQSRTGRTRTAPADAEASDVKLAFASCQSFENGYYGSWARMLADDRAAAPQDRIQFVLHLGDFIYERSWHKRVDGSPQVRRVPPFPDGMEGEVNRHAVSLADYRHLYQTYLSDPWLQAARARWPFICTWDDHEFSNDNYQSYSNYESGPELTPQRKRDANKAWFEYIPAVLDELEEQPAHGFRASAATGEDSEQANRAARDSLCIYRRLRWGRQLDILLTDTRSYRSPPCLPEGFAAQLGLPMPPSGLVEIADAGREWGGGRPPEFLPYGEGDTPNPARDRAPGSCLGEQQRTWFLETLENSSARWKLWGNALPLIPMRVDLSALPFAGYEDSVFNLDAWAGYPHEVALLMQRLESAGVTGLVSLSGDHHMHGAGTIRASADSPESRPVMVDFTVAGISSSPIFDNLEWVARKDHAAFQPLVFREDEDGILPLWNATLLRGALAAAVCARTGLDAPARWLGPNRANPGLSYVDSRANGYGLARFSGDALEVEMVTMSDVHSPFEEAPAIRHRARFRVPAWEVEQGPSIEGPDFEGGAPFPFEPPPV